MKDFKLLSDNDIALYQDLPMISGGEVVAQSAAIILKTSLGEFVLEPELGLTRANILTRFLNTEFIVQDITDALLNQSKLIERVEDFKFSQDKHTRALSISFRIVATTGKTEEVEVELSD